VRLLVDGKRRSNEVEGERMEVQMVEESLAITAQ